ncbi:MAG: hypothetical protein L0L57_07815 [Alkalibacterium sp.]|nr:hypothetical protein [Alkalibacterium sp.]
MRIKNQVRQELGRIRLNQQTILKVLLSLTPKSTVIRINGSDNRKVLKMLVVNLKRLTG